MIKSIQTIKGYKILRWKSNIVGICQKTKSNQEFIFKVAQDTTEVQIMKKNKDHQYLTSMVKQVKLDKHIVIIMEKGQCDLKMYVNKFTNGKINDKNLQNLTRSILKGLQSMHKRKIWHRDLKPQNIYVFLKDEDDDIEDPKTEVYAKLGDFGLSKQVEQQKQLTKGIGTLVYQAPEIMNGSSNYNQRIDIWALGLTLFQLYSKENYENFFNSNKGLAFTNEGVDKIRKYLKQRLQSVIAANGLLLKKLYLVIDASIQFNPDKRESIGYFIKLFQLEEQNFRSPDEEAKIQSLKVQKKYDVQLKMQRYQNTKKKLDILIQTAQTSSDIIMKKAMIKNLKRQQIQIDKILEQYRYIDKNIDQLIQAIIDYKKQQEIKEIEGRKNASFTKMKNQVNDYRIKESKKLDLCFMIDVTGSMDDLIATVQQHITEISDLVKEQFTDIRLACVAYRDCDSSTQVHKPQIFQFTSDPKELLQKISNLVAHGGDDTAQDINGGFQGLFNLDWQQYTKAVIHFTDAPCHLKQYNNLQQDDDSYLNKVPKYNLPYKKIFKQLRSIGINYFFIPLGNSILRKSLDFMFQKYKSDWDNAKVYRGRSNIVGQVSKFDAFTLEQFKNIIKGAAKQTIMITNKSIKFKRRLNNQQALISAADQLNDNQEFDQ